MTQQDARERATRLVERCARGVASAQEGMDLRGLFEDLWKRREEDEQRIAALVAAAKLAPHNKWCTTFFPTPDDYLCNCPTREIDAALRALAGQTEEVVS